MNHEFATGCAILRAQYLDKLKSELVRRLEDYGSYHGLIRHPMGSYFIDGLISGNHISNALLHMAVECAAQDFWSYTPFSESHFRAVGMAQTDISAMKRIAAEYHSDLAKIFAPNSDESGQFAQRTEH